MSIRGRRASRFCPSNGCARLFRRFMAARHAPRAKKERDEAFVIRAGRGWMVAMRHAIGRSGGGARPARLWS